VILLSLVPRVEETRSRDEWRTTGNQRASR
jgi:hypothetical protein